MLFWEWSGLEINFELWYMVDIGKSMDRHGWHPPGRAVQWDTPRGSRAEGKGPWKWQIKRSYGIVGLPSAYTWCRRRSLPQATMHVQCLQPYFSLILNHLLKAHPNIQNSELLKCLQSWYHRAEVLQDSLSEKRSLLSTVKHLLSWSGHKF